VQLFPKLGPIVPRPPAPIAPGADAHEFDWRDVAAALARVLEVRGEHAFECPAKRIKSATCACGLTGVLEAAEAAGLLKGGKR